MRGAAIRPPAGSFQPSASRAVIVDRSAFQLTLYKDLKLGKTYGIAVGQVGLETPGRALPHPEQGGEPGLERARTRPGRATSRGTVVPGGTPENPLKARWLGIFDGAGIHGTDAIGSIGTRRLARLHPHADPRRDRALRPGAGRRADLHRLARVKMPRRLRLRR